MTDIQATQVESPPKRVPLWDNARFLCVTLVVIGHGVQRITYDDDYALIVYLFIYAFHMPAFAIISGYFSKPGSPTKRQMKRVLTDILLPYFIMETIWTLVQFVVEDKHDFNPSRPSWTLWFLLALGIFRLIFPYLSLVRYPLAWSLVFSVGVGYLSNIDSTFSLSRAIGILPFFVFGWKLKEWGIAERWQRVEKHVWWVRAVAIAVFAGWLATVWLFLDTWKAVDLRLWFFYKHSYSGLGMDGWYAGLIQLALIVLATLLSLAFLALVPRSNTVLTRFGQATMYIYLLHSFVLYPLRETGVLRGEHPTLPWLGGTIVLCVLISFALGSRITQRLFWPLIEPKPRWLLLKQDTQPPTEPSGDPPPMRRVSPGQ